MAKKVTKKKKKKTVGVKSALTLAKKKQISLRMVGKSHEKLVRAAAKDGRSINEYILRLLKDKKAA